MPPKITAAMPSVTLPSESDSTLNTPGIPFASTSVPVNTAPAEVVLPTSLCCSIAGDDSVVITLRSSRSASAQREASAMRFSARRIARSIGGSPLFWAS